MTTRFYGVTFGGETRKDVTEAAGTTGLDVELQVIFTNPNASRFETIQALNAILEKVETDPWPPA